MEECILLIMEELTDRGIGNEHTLAYKSLVGRVQWLKPYIDEVLVELGQKGAMSLLAVPVSEMVSYGFYSTLLVVESCEYPSFVSEHIETLEEIDMEYNELALESDIKNWARVPTLVDHDPVRYFMKLFLGSILAFILFLSPK